MPTLQTMVEDTLCEAAEEGFFSHYAQQQAAGAQALVDWLNADLVHCEFKDVRVTAASVLSRRSLPLVELTVFQVFPGPDSLEQLQVAFGPKFRLVSATPAADAALKHVLAGFAAAK